MSNSIKDMEQKLPIAKNIISLILDIAKDGEEPTAAQMKQINIANLLNLSDDELKRIDKAAASPSTEETVEKYRDDAKKEKKSFNGVEFFIKLIFSSNADRYKAIKAIDDKKTESKKKVNEANLLLLNIKQKKS